SGDVSGLCVGERAGAAVWQDQPETQPACDCAGSRPPENRGHGLTAAPQEKENSDKRDFREKKLLLPEIQITEIAGGALPLQYRLDFACKRHNKHNHME